MTQCNVCIYNIDVNSEAKNRPVQECRVDSPTCGEAGKAQWPILGKNEIGCAYGQKKKDE